MSLPDRSVDISFHNGFYTYFRDDTAIINLLREQARITRKFVVILIHNAENQNLVEDFKEKSKKDDLYKIRFFHRDEIKDLIRKSGIPIRFLSTRKFGGPADRLYGARLGRFPNPFRRFAHRLVARLYDLQPWSTTERVACLVELG